MLKTAGRVGAMSVSRHSAKTVITQKSEARISPTSRVYGRLTNTRSPSLRFNTLRNLRPKQSRQQEVVVSEASATPISKQASTESAPTTEKSPRFSPAAEKQLTKAIRALRGYGWFGFWSQLTLGVTSGIVLLFSIAYTAQAGPRVSLYLTALGVSATFIACFQYFGMVRISRRLRAYLEAPPGVSIKKISKETVVNSITQGLATSMAGLGCTVIGMQSSVGLLLAKTLTNASANPFVVGTQGTWNPVLAFDVFLLQASTNTILSHTIGGILSLWLLIKLSNRSLWEALFGIPKTTAP